MGESLSGATLKGILDEIKSSSQAQLKQNFIGDPKAIEAFQQKLVTFMK